MQSMRGYLAEDRQLIYATFIGYRYGTYSKLGIVCESSPIRVQVQEEEESKDGAAVQVDESCRPNADSSYVKQ